MTAACTMLTWRHAVKTTLDFNENDGLAVAECWHVQATKER